MSINATTLLEENVRTEWVDYNGHMNDAEYARVFSMAVDSLMEEIGLDADFRNHHHYSIYTLETHMCYIAEAHEGEALTVSLQLLDHDSKRLHIFFTMHNSEGEPIATSEQMLMGMDMKEGRPALFPPVISTQVENLANTQKDLPTPLQVGRKIGIRKK